MVHTVWTGFRLASILAVSAVDAYACSRFARRERDAINSRFLNKFDILGGSISGIFTPPEGSNAHGLNEKLPGKSHMRGIGFCICLGRGCVMVRNRVGRLFVFGDRS